MTSDQYRQRSQNTKEVQRPLMDELDARFGGGQLQDLTPKCIKMIRNDFRDRHGASAAKIVLGVISTVWKFIFEEDPDLAANPTAGISRLYKTENEREPWPDEVLEAFEKSAPLKLRLAFYIALYSGQRRSDVAKMEWPQRVERDGKLWLKVRPQKTQKKGTEYLEVPCHRTLRAALDAIPVEQRTAYIIKAKSGAPYSPRTLAQAFRRILYQLNVPWLLDPWAA
jgi:integrase